MATTFPTTVDTATQLYTAVNGVQTTLTAGISNSDTVVPVTDTTSFPSVGYFVVGTEIISYTGKTGTTFTGCTRGANGSVAASHVSMDVAYARIVADHHNALMNAIIAVEQNIVNRFGLSTNIVVPSGVSFTINSAAGLTITPTSGVNSINLTGSLNEQLSCLIYNSNTGAAAQAALRLVVTGAAASDPFIEFKVNDVTTTFTTGIDNSDSDAFVISRSATLGTDNALKISADSGAVAIRGSATSDSAATGFVGEYVESVVGATSFPATTVIGDATSISLTAGDWDVSLFAQVGIFSTGTRWIAAITTSPGNSATGWVDGSNRLDAIFNSAVVITAGIPSYRMSLSGTTTVYFKMFAEYASGSPTIRGRLSARRVR